VDLLLASAGTQAETREDCRAWWRRKDWPSSGEATPGTGGKDGMIR